MRGLILHGDGRIRERRPVHLLAYSLYTVRRLPLVFSIKMTRIATIHPVPYLGLELSADDPRRFVRLSRYCRPLLHQEVKQRTGSLSRLCVCEIVADYRFESLLYWPGIQPVRAANSSNVCRNLSSPKRGSFTRFQTVVREQKLVLTDQHLLDPYKNQA